MGYKRNWRKDWELCEKATPGPWKIISGVFKDQFLGKEFDEVRIERIGPVEPQCRFADSYEGAVVWLNVSDEDALFVSEAREALPYWLERTKELEEENAKLKIEIEKLTR